MRTRSKRQTVLTILGVLLLGWLIFTPTGLFDNTPYSTVLLDKDGEMLSARIAGDGQWRFPPTDSIPDKYRKALIAFEDKYFYLHPGVNPLAIGRAAVQNIRSGKIESGGSTITMQLVRMSRQRERNLWQKMLEAVIALRIELKWSKDEILSLYASNAPFGGNVVGIDAALWRYWNRTNHDISWAEAATLAVLPNAPSAIHVEKNRPALLEKRNRLLKRLLDDGTIDRSTYLLSIEEPLPEGVCAVPNHAPHLVDYADSHNPGVRMKTEIDIHLQAELEDMLAFRQRQNTLVGYADLSAVIIDVATGKPVAYCGNADYTPTRHGSQVDILRAARSTGSILKPFLYKYLIETGKILPEMLVADIPLAIDGFAPQNFDYEYRGAVYAHKALKASLNIPAVNALLMAGIPEFVDYLRQSGMTTLTRDNSEYGLSVILGGAEGSLLEITRMYAAMARDARLPAQWYTLNALRDDKYDIAAKTGTSYGYRDAWAVGVNQKYAVGVWAGNASGAGAPNLTGGTAAMPVLYDIFNILPHTGWFDRLQPADGLTQIAVCRHSGHPAGEYCTDTDSLIVTSKSHAVQVCPYHKPVCLTADNRYRTTPVTEGAHIVNAFVLPPIMEHYYIRSHPEYRPLPPRLNAQNHASDTETSLTFITPKNNAKVVLPRQLDGTTQGVLVKVAQTTAPSTLHWFVDSNYTGSTETVHDMNLHTPTGRHRITVVDEYGNSASLHIDVRIAAEH